MLMPRRKNDWVSQTFDTPEKLAKFYYYFNILIIVSYIMIIIGFILFIFIVGGVIKI
jgi:hypothetical protein